MSLIYYLLLYKLLQEMQVESIIESKKVHINTNVYYDISIPLVFDSPDRKAIQANSFGVEKANSEPYRVGNFIGDTRNGSSVNFDKITLIPHCNGTHTECIGHITDERIDLRDSLNNFFSLAKLITVDTVDSEPCSENYLSGFETGDRLITKNLLIKQLPEIRGDIKSLIIRTLPNDESKKNRDYEKDPAAFFTNDAMEYISEFDLDNLIVDLPSLDKAKDDGKLSNHRIWWGISQGSKERNGSKKNSRTITEFTFIDNKILDGEYLLNFQIPNFSGDAVPSRLLIFPIK